VKERPILFSGPMVRAILDGTKTMTRRIVKPQPVLTETAGLAWKGGVWGMKLDGQPYTDEFVKQCPYGVPGDRLWLRETHAQAGTGRVFYRADEGTTAPRWTPAIHMPRALSRSDLEVTAVRVERLQGITEEDVRAEGVRLPVSEEGHPLIQVPNPYAKPVRQWTISDYWRCAFACLWDEINGARASWASNPWVWVVSFKRVRP